MRFTSLLSAGALFASFTFGLSAQGITHAVVTLDDSFILGVRATVDEEEIETARWAATHGSTREVRDFAQSLLRGHTSAQNRAETLAYNLGVALKTPGDTDRAISARNAAAQTELRQLRGANFDRAFLTAIRDEHASEIDKVNTWYASIVASDTVKAYLHEIMPTLIKHEQTAERLLANSGKTVAIR